MATGQVRWLPLESNPDVMTKFLTDLGLPEPWAVVDVLGFDDDLLAILPQPVAALILLFPVSKVERKEEGDESLIGKVYWMKQTIRNACGTIALLHSVGNNTDKIQLTEGSLLRKFFDNTSNLDPQDIGKQLENNTDISSTHETHAQEGQTSAPDISEEIDFHFVAFVERNGHLYQLDGCKKGPIDHGQSTPESFLKDAAAVCRQIVSQNPDCLNFTAVALSQVV
ncbi:Ubiquitin carboxyl-terminal hydrolase isozyme L3 [Halotydeus destructor]|nr:Ubiquitin carboxyl-terminal hydrolase isozyme L3 [Halotydeus destructor]